jgi:uncharacterized protein YjdB
MKRIFQIITMISLAALLSCSRDRDEYVSVIKVDLNKETTMVYVGGLERLLVTIHPAEATEKGVGWFSDDPTVATVDGKGLVRGISVGMTVIRITDSEGRLYPATCAVLVQNSPVPVTGVSLNKAAATVSINGSEQLNYTIVPAHATNKNVTWSSNNNSVATVDSNSGTVTGLSVGTATITLTSDDGKLTSSCTVTVQNDPIPVTGILPGKATSTISVNGAEQMLFTVYPENATNKSVTWSSNDSSVATVDVNGNVTGVSAGTVTVTAKTAEGEFAASCVITVQNEAVPVTGVSLKTASTISVNGTEQLTATVSPENATNKNVVWSSNAVSVATVDEKGLVAGISAGMATVTAKTEDGEFTSSCVITVRDETIPVTGVSVDKATLAIYIGDVEELRAEVAPGNATNKSVTWSSSAEAVATVDENGSVRGVSAGTATITAKTGDGEFTSNCTVRVDDETGSITSTGWTAPAANSYEYSMTYVAQVAFRGTLSADPNTEVAAFVGNELRGYARLIHEPRLNAYLVHLIIYSNSAGNETVTLKAFNPSKKRIYDNCKEFTFQGNASLGSTSEILNCLIN